MGSIKRVQRTTGVESAPIPPISSFEKISEAELETHLAVAKYGDFTLTDAIRPSYDLKVTPKSGYRFDSYKDPETGSVVPVIMASASREILFDIFLEMLEPLGEEVDVVLETSHTRGAQGHVDLYREHIDMPVLKSMLCDYEHLLLNDGCTGIAVLNPAAPQEVQFDEHKLVIAYGKPLDRFEEILKSYGLVRDDKMRFITEAEHVHSSNDKLFDQFDELRMRLGMDAEIVCDDQEESMGV
jgi:hypothetical protein